MDYDKIKKKQEENQWTSNSDLFMVLSMVFLLLYVVTNLRSGTVAIINKAERKELVKEKIRLEQQIRVYKTLKDDYLERKATVKDREFYGQIMDKLKYLKSESEKNRLKLKRNLAESEKKVEALTEYQKIVKNIIDSNYVNKNRLDQRAEIIEKKKEIIESQNKIIADKEKDIEEKEKLLEKREIEIKKKQNVISLKETEILEQNQKINSLSLAIKAREKEISENDQVINKMKDDLNKKVNELKVSYRNQKRTKESYESELIKVKEMASQKISQLERKNVSALNELNQKKRDLTFARSEIENQNREKLKLESKIVEEKEKIAEKYQDEMNRLQKEFNEKLKIENKNFKDKINQQKLSFTERMQKEEDYKNKVLRDRAGLNKQLLALKGKINSIESSNKKLKEEKKETYRELASVKSDQERLVTRYQNQINNLKSDFNSKLMKERSKLKGEFEKEKYSLSIKAQKEKEFGLKIGAEKKILNKKVQDLKDKISKMSEKLGDAEKERSGQIKAMESLKKSYQGQIESLKEQFAKSQKEAEEKFNKKLKNGLLSKSDRNKFENLSSAKAKNLENLVSHLNSKVKDAQKQIDSLKKENESLGKGRKDLRGQIAKKIIDSFQNAGISAQVDKVSGEVTLSFKDSYFELGKFQLKEEMKKEIRKFIPIYAESIFGKDEIANKIKNIEIIGYASPTYKGKYVDPLNLSEENQKAINFNLDLSYYRAKSFFKYMFYDDSVKFKHKKKILPIVKVIGRSYLANSLKGRDIATNTSINEFCSKYDCEKAQKVSIKFNLKD